MPYSWPVTPTEVDAELNTDASANPELQGFIDSITRVVEHIVGPITSTPYVEWYDGGGDVIVLTHYPVLSVDEVIEYSRSVPTTLAGEPLDTTTTFTHAGYQFNPSTGELLRTSGGSPYWFPAGIRNVKVSYHAGRTDVPPNVREAALELIRLHWKPQRSGGPSTLGIDRPGGEDSNDQEILGYLVPRKVLDTLLPDRKAPGVA